MLLLWLHNFTQLLFFFTFSGLTQVLFFYFASISFPASILQEKKEYDQVWCVFDRDSFPANNFNDAIQLAAKYKIRVVYSNEAFELWYLLYFHYYDTALSRADYIVKLKQLLPEDIKRKGATTTDYKKNDSNIYEKIIGKQSDAIRNAKKLLSQYSSSNPETDNPSTTVYALVEELNKFIR